MYGCGSVPKTVDLDVAAGAVDERGQRDPPRRDVRVGVAQVDRVDGRQRGAEQELLLRREADGHARRTAAGVAHVAQRRAEHAAAGGGVVRVELVARPRRAKRRRRALTGPPPRSSRRGTRATARGSRRCSATSSSPRPGPGACRRRSAAAAAHGDGVGQRVARRDQSAQRIRGSRRVFAGGLALVAELRVAPSAGLRRLVRA